MDRQSRPLTGEAMPQGRPTGAAFRAREFRRSATLTWRGEGFETDNLARQSAGMRRAATLPHGSTRRGETMRPKLKNRVLAKRTREIFGVAFGETNPRSSEWHFGGTNPGTRTVSMADGRPSETTVVTGR